MMAYDSSLVEAAVLFSGEEECTGKSLAIWDSYESLKRTVIEERLTSIHIPRGYTVLIYSQENFTGQWL